MTFEQIHPLLTQAAVNPGVPKGEVWEEEEEVVYFFTLFCQPKHQLLPPASYFPRRFDGEPRPCHR